MKSLLDPENKLPIDENWSVVTIVRKPEGSNPEHAFLLVEGMNSFQQIMFKRYDLVMDKDHDGQYKILIKEKSATPATASSVLFSDILGNEEVSGLCFSLRKDQSIQLHENILDSQNNPGKYNLIGDVATIPKTGDAIRATAPESAETTSDSIVDLARKAINPATAALVNNALQASGHNCFTWARNMLLSLNDARINKALPTKLEEVFASITSRHLKQAEPSKRSCCVM